MDKEGFINIISTDLEKRIGKHVATEPLKKLGMTYTALSIYSRTSAAFNVDRAYEDYRNGRSLIEICDEAEGVLKTRPKSSNELLDAVLFFDEAKPRLFIRVCNYERNAEYLATVPHVQMLDLAITFHLLLFRNNESEESITVTDSLVYGWEVGLDTLLREAKVSAERLYPATLANLSEVFGIKSEQPSNVMVLSNQYNVYGAAALLYRDTFDKLNSHFKEGCYLIPSSVHEIIAIDSRNVNASTLIEILRANNNDRNLIREEDVLSDTLYFLDHTGLRRYSDA